MIISSVPSMKVASSLTAPAELGTIMTHDCDGDRIKEHWNYRSVIGMKTFLDNYTYP